MGKRHRIQFPAPEGRQLDQDEAFFYLIEGDRKVKLRLHDYDQLYLRPGLYEQVVYDRLKCTSPTKVGEILSRTLNACGSRITELRVLDLGAGNGIMGEVMKSYGVARMVGVDIVPEARNACYRDRPAVYDEYYVADFTDLEPKLAEEIEEWQVDCLTSVAALGFGDVPVSAFCRAVGFVQTGGWLAFNIKETFLAASDTSGFSRFVRELISSEYLDVYHMERYRHRFSMDGEPLFYFALVGQKLAEVPEDLEHELMDGNNR